jgi:hypothetical protein
MNRKCLALGPAVAAVGAIVLSGACAKTVTKGELMVSLQTDMAPPKDFDNLEIQVLLNGGIYLDDNWEIPMDQALPATYAIVQGAQANQQVDVRILARQNGVLRVLREVVTTIPNNTAILRMPVEFLCYGQVVNIEPGQVPESSCPQGQTCIAGSCADAVIDSTTLQTFQASEVFGGAAQAGSGGTCLDTVGCFGAGFRVTPDANCTVPAPQGGMGTNIALVNVPGGTGICGPDACLIPLDQGTDGWQLINGRIQLPPAVCTQLAAGDVLSVAATTACTTKTPAIPTCGPWSSVTTTTATFDAAAPANSVILDASSEAEAEAEASEPEAAPEDSGPVCASMSGFTQTPCDIVEQTGCQTGEACTVTGPTSTGCVTSAGTSGGTEGFGCCVPAFQGNTCDGANEVDCADGLVCVGPAGTAYCRGFCCDSSQCVVFESTDNPTLLCNQISLAGAMVAGGASAADGGATADGGAAADGGATTEAGSAALGYFGVCVP